MDESFEQLPQDHLVYTLDVNEVLNATNASLIVAQVRTFLVTETISHPSWIYTFIDQQGIAKLTQILSKIDLNFQ
jgi:hypothetical protein